MFKDVVVAVGLLVATGAFVTCMKELTKPVAILPNTSYTRVLRSDPETLRPMAKLLDVQSQSPAAQVGRDDHGEVRVAFKGADKSVFVRLSPNATEVTTVQGDVAETKVLFRDGEVDEYSRDVDAKEGLGGTPRRSLKSLLPGRKGDVTAEVSRVAAAAQQVAYSF